MWFSLNRRAARREAQAQVERDHQAALAQARREVAAADPYTFCVEMDAEGWRWDVLYQRVHRHGLSYSYCPIDGAFGHEPTREAAFAAGRAKCQQFTEAKRWRDQRKYFRLTDPVTV